MPSQVSRCARHTLGIPSLGLRLLINREPPDFNRHVRGRSSRSRRRRNPARYGISAFRSRYVNNPVAQQKLLRLGEKSVTGMPFFAPRTTFASAGSAEPCVATNSPDPVRSFVRPQDRHMRLNIFLRPGVIPINARLRTGHQQNVFHIFLSYFVLMP